MNLIYRLVFNRARGLVQAVAETARGHGAAGTGRRLRRAAVRATVLEAALSAAGLSTAWSQALPHLAQATGAAVSTAGSQMTITQSAARAVLNWRDFNIGQGAGVTFRQPDARAVALNLVDAAGGRSLIDGTLSANGRVFLMNPAGIIFGPTARVNVGSLVASTLGVAGEDRTGYTLARGGAPAAAVVNHGIITTADGGSVNLVGSAVANDGTIIVPGGSVRLVAADSLRLTVDEAGALGVQVTAAVTQAVDGADSAITNAGTIEVAGGQALLQATATPGLYATLVNNQGTIAANGIDTAGGVIRLVALGGDTVSTGTLSATGTRGGTVHVLSDQHVQVDGDITATGSQGGGAIRLGGGLRGGEGLLQAASATVGRNAKLDASATDNGQGGTIAIWSTGKTDVAAVVAARGGAAGGDGGLIETSGHRVSVSADLIDTRAPEGKTGQWLIDPYNVVISNGTDSGVDASFNAMADDTVINATTLANALATTGVTVATGSGGGQAGDITVNTPVSWSADTTLALNAAGSIYANAPITVNGTGTGAGLALNYGGTDGNASATPATGTDYHMAPSAAVTFAGTNESQASFSINGTPYTLIRDMEGLANIDTAGLAGHYALAGDLDASTYTGDAAGSSYIGQSGSVPFTGTFAGMGHAISNLAFSYPNSEEATTATGLFGFTGSTSLIRDVSVSTMSDFVSLSGTYGGVLVGENQGAITNAHATGNVQSTEFTMGGGLVGYNQGTIRSAGADVAISGANVALGGLVGRNDGSIESAYATGAISAEDHLGGLVGINAGTIVNAYASGAIAGGTHVGGLVGTNAGDLKYVYATGSVSEVNGVASPALGGLVGSSSGGTVTSGFYATTNADGTSINQGLSGNDQGTGKSHADLQEIDTFTQAGWTIDDLGGTSNAWRIYAGEGTPLVRSLLTPLAITPRAPLPGKTYDGQALAGTLAEDQYAKSIQGAEVTGTDVSYRTSSKPAGTYAGTDGSLVVSGLSSNQQGYDIIYDMGTTITPRSLTVTTQDKTYDGTTQAVVDASGVLSGDQVIASGSFADKNVGQAKPVTTALYGSDARNYTSGAATAAIAPAPLSIRADDETRASGSQTPLSGWSVASGHLYAGDAIDGVLLRLGDASSVTIGTTRYPIVPFGAWGAGLGNYQVSYLNGWLTETVIPADAAANISQATATLLPPSWSVQPGIGNQISGGISGTGSDALLSGGASVTIHQQEPSIVPAVKNMICGVTLDSGVPTCAITTAK